MADYVPLTNLRGPAARITEVTAEEVPAGSDLTPILSGPDQNRKIGLKIPKGERGLPGVNAVANDTATAGYLAAPDSESAAAARTLVDSQVDSRVIVRYAAGQPNRPNVILGGLQNGSDILAGTIHSVLLQPGGPGYNNIIGGDGTATVSTSTPNAIDPTITNVGVSLIGGYDNVVGSISGKIISDHSYTAKGSAGHNAIFGGQGHIIGAAGSYSMIAGGDLNRINGAYSFTTGRQNRVDGGYASASGHQNAVETSGAYSTVSGQGNNVLGVFSLVAGYSNRITAAATAGSALGAYASARRPFQQVIAPGRNVADGDAQTSVTPFRLVTTDAVARPLIAAYTGVGSGTQFILEPGQSVKFRAEVVGRYATGDTAVVMEISGVAQRPLSGNAVILGSPTATALYQPVPAVTSAMAITAATGHLSIMVTGVAATEIRWVARFTTVEVMA